MERKTETIASHAMSIQAKGVLSLGFSSGLVLGSVDAIVMVFFLVGDIFFAFFCVVMLCGSVATILTVFRLLEVSSDSVEAIVSVCVVAAVIGVARICGALSSFDLLLLFYVL